MHKNKFIAKIINTYFNPDLDLRVQSFNLLMLLGIATGIIVALITIIIKEPTIITIIDLIIPVLAFILLRIAQKERCYHLCSWIIIIVVFMFTFPMMFVFYGGYKNGISCFLVLAIVFTAHMLEKHERTVAIVVEFIIYITCCLGIYYNPEWAAGSQSGQTDIINVMLNFVSSGLLLLTAIILRNRIINIRQMQVQELNRELEARNETLIRYDRMKSDFLSTVAHEINTPLAVIAASSHDTLDLLKMQPFSVDEIEENQIIIAKRVKLIDSIILDLMDTVAIEAGRLPLSREPVDLCELLKNVCNTQFKLLNKNENTITYDLPHDLPHIWLDPARIEQVMINLLSNAVQHTKSGIINVKVMRSEKRQIVCVADNGEGMDAEMVRVALKQYVSTKADHWRHGIGLNICRQIIMAHGGEIWIDSEKGRGTSLFFALQEEFSSE